MFPNSKKLKSLFKRPSGFTLTEVLVIVLIIAVLAAIAYPLYSKAVNKSRAVEAINLLEIVRTKQVANYARTRQYYSDFTSMGQLTTNPSKETASGASMSVGDYYTLALNKAKSCMSATYSKGGTAFTFSTSYENAGLGCTGDICASFGNVVGSAQEVCNCGDKVCKGNLQLDKDTCECGCSSPSICRSGDYCSLPSQNKETRKACSEIKSSYTGGMATRTCTVSCDGGSCGGWDETACTSEPVQVCTPDDTETVNCGNCNTGTNTRTCNSSGSAWGDWSGCSGGGECTSGDTQSCGGGNGLQTCSSSCGWNNTTCVCNSGYTWDESTCAQDSVECTGTKPTLTQNCGTKCGTKSGTVDCNSETGQWKEVEWSDTCSNEGVCEKDSAHCTSTCSCETGYTWDGSTSTCKQDSIECSEENKPALEQSCGICGTQSGTVACDTATGQWKEVEWDNCVGSTEPQACGNCGTQTCKADGSDWDDCTGQGVCSPGTMEQEACGCQPWLGEKTRTCGDTCAWGNWNTDGCAQYNGDDGGESCTEAEFGAQRPCCDGSKIQECESTWVGGGNWNECHSPCPDDTHWNGYKCVECDWWGQERSCGNNQCQRCSVDESTMSLVWYPCGYWSCGGSDSTPPPTGSWRIEIEDIAVLSVNPLSNGQPIQAYNTYCRDSAVSYNTALLGSSSYSGYTKKCVDIRPNQFTDNGGGGSCPITKYYYIFGADNNVQEAVCATGEDLPNQCNSYNNNPSVCTSNNQIACVNSIIPSHNAVYVMKSDCTIGPFAGVASNYYECRDGSNKSREKGVTVKVGTVKGSVCKRN